MLGAAGAPAAASAQLVQLGDQTKSPLVAPTCPPGVTPAQCTIILTRDTALATIRDGVSYPTEVKRAGRIVAFSVGLSALSSNSSTRQKDIHYLNSTYGGDAQVQIAVLRRVGKHGQRWRVMSETRIFHVVQFLGSVAMFPLIDSLPVKPKEVIALSTPTWAPVLSIDQPTRKFAYRQARGSHPNCSSPPTSQQAQKVGQISKYGCKYAGTRVEYAATEVTYPKASNGVH